MILKMHILVHHSHKEKHKCAFTIYLHQILISELERNLDGHNDLSLKNQAEVLKKTANFTK
jgi:hypothetical protein